MIRLSHVPAFFRELRRRRVVQTLVAYLVVGLAVLEGTEILVPRLGFPDMVASVVVLVVAAGLPVSLIVSWVYDLKAGGLVRDPQDVAARETGPPGPERRERDPRAVAVLPFVNLTPSGAEDYFSEGMTEEITAALCRLPDIRVICRSSVVEIQARTGGSVREMGDFLGVAMVVEGSVRRQGGRVRILAKAVEVESEVTVWSESYDRETEDVFAIQSDVAGHVAQVMAARLTPEMTKEHIQQRTGDAEAYDLYLKALYLWNRRSRSALEQGLELLQSALARDPGFVLAHAGVGMIQLTRGIYGIVGPDVVLGEGLPAAERALEADPHMPEALVTRGCIRALYRWEWDEAEADLRRALEIKPSYATGLQWLAVNVLAPRKGFQAAEEALLQAEALDPVAPVVGLTRGVLSYFKRDYPAALAAYREVKRTHPGFTATHLFLAQALVAAGEPGAAVEELQEGLSARPGSVETLATLGYAMAVAGQTGGARDVLDRLRLETGWVSPVFPAQIHLALGEEAAALDHLERAAEVRAPDLAWIGVRPTFDPLREAPRFRALLARTGLDA